VQQDRLPGDTPLTIAQHFAAFINSVYVGVWAEVLAGELTIHSRSAAAAYSYSLAAWVQTTTQSGSTGAAAVSGTLGQALAAFGGNYVAGTRSR